MNRFTYYIGAASLAVITANAHAIPLLDLFNGGTITVGDKLFADWESINVTDPDAGALDLSAITVTGIGDGTAGNAYGLNFAFGDQFGLGSDTEGDFFDFLDLEFGYSVEAAAGWVISGVSIASSGSASGDNAFYTVQKDAYSDAGRTNSIWGAGGFLEVCQDTFDPSCAQTDSAGIAGLSKIWLLDNIAVEYDAFFGASAAELDSFEQRFTQRDTGGDVPTPGTLALFALGLLGFAMMRRGRTQRL